MYAMRGCPVIPLVRKSLPAYLHDGIPHDGEGEGKGKGERKGGKERREGEGWRGLENERREEEEGKRSNARLSYHRPLFISHLPLHSSSTHQPAAMTR
jgi:hypothetical protein